MGELEKKMSRKKNEHGRSIVETLGVLAIMGILSLVGLYGYSNAMKRYQANDLLNEANKRAVVVSMDIAAGGILSDKASENVGVLSEFTDSSNDRFTVSRKNKDQFDINIADVPKDVCEQMKTGLGPVVRGISPCPEEGNGDVSLTFNNDMSAATKAGDYDGDKSACEEAGNTYCEDSDTCVAPGETCPSDNLGCPAQAPETGLGGHATTLPDGTMCYCKEKDTIYQDGTCQPKPENCSSYRDCNRGEYCQFSPTNSYGDPNSGVCQSLSTCGSGKTYTATDGKTFWMDTDNSYNECHADWWSAADICHAKGMQMISLSDVKCKTTYKNTYQDSSCDNDYVAALAENLKDDEVWTSDKRNSYYFTVFIDYTEPFMQSASPDAPYGVNNILCRSKTFSEISPKPTDYNGNESACTSSGYIYCQSNDECVETEEECPSYDSGCPSETSEVGLGGHAVTLSDGTRCYCETEDRVYQNNVCQVKPDGCSSYRDCNRGEYCQFSPYACNRDPDLGTCASLSKCIDLGSYSAADGKTFWAAEGRNKRCMLDWWTARDICRSKGMQMVSLADVKCNKTTCEDNYSYVFDINNSMDFPESGLADRLVFLTTDMENDCSVYFVNTEDHLYEVGYTLTTNNQNDGDSVLCVSK